MSLKYNFGGIEGAASAVQGTVQPTSTIKDALATYTADGTQSGDNEDINIGVGELQECTISKSNDGVAVDDLIVNAVISEADYAGGDAGTKGSGLPTVQVRDLQLDQNFDVMAGTALPSVTDLILDPYNPKTGEVGDMDSFVFEDSTSGAGLSPMGWDILKNDAFNGSEPDPSGRLLVGTDGGIWSDGDGKDALAMYQPDTVDTDLSLSAVDVVIPATLAEYGLLL